MIFMENDIVMDQLLRDFAFLTKKPYNFLRANETTAAGLKGTTKSIFDLAITCLKDKNALPIQELIVEDFDQEQIWQELELLNNLEWPALSREVSQVVAQSRHVRRAVQHGDGAEQADAEHEAADHSDDDDMGRDDCDDLEENASGDEEDSGEDEEADSGDERTGSRDEGENSLPERPRVRGSAVDDRFFHLDELEQFLERHDRRFERERGRRPDQDNGGMGVDLFSADAGAELPSTKRQQADEEQPMFSDFFDPPDGGTETGRRVEPQDAAPSEQPPKKRILASDSEGEDAADILGSAKKSTEGKSTLEIRQERLKSRISQLEEQNLAEKPWQQRGETSAAGRHENALLEEYVDFEQTRRAPETTAEVTAEIERLIRRRIRDAAWDDVERKVKPVTDPYEYKKKLLLDQEKSKLSLAQIYEQEYLKQKSEAEQKPEVDLSMAYDEVEDVPKEHEEIRRLMADLSAKLDTLTHFHYMPKQASAEVRIISKLPSIAMEEITPLGSSNATLLAPEEIKDKRRSQLLAKEERTATDKKRERRKKKHRQALKARNQERKERELAGKTPERRGAAASKRLAEAQVARAEKRGLVTRATDTGGKKALKSSTAFFSQLQDQVTAQVSAAKPGKKKKKKSTSADVAKMRL